MPWFVISCILSRQALRADSTLDATSDLFSCTSHCTNRTLSQQRKRRSWSAESPIRSSSNMDSLAWQIPGDWTEPRQTGLSARSQTPKGRRPATHCTPTHYQKAKPVTRAGNLQDVKAAIRALCTRSGVVKVASAHRTLSSLHLRFNRK